MPKKPSEIEKIILADGWIFDSQTGSHRHYKFNYETSWYNFMLSIYPAIFLRKKMDILLFFLI